jgi:hypothetical protein
VRRTVSATAGRTSLRNAFLMTTPTHSVVHFTGDSCTGSLSRV